MVSAIKMANVLEDVLPKSIALLCDFLRARSLNADGMHKEILSGECLSRNAVQNYVEKRFTDDEEVENKVQKRLRQKSKDFYMF
jgi:hypothetical protein